MVSNYSSSQHLLIHVFFESPESAVSRSICAELMASDLKDWPLENFMGSCFCDHSYEKAESWNNSLAAGNCVKVIYLGALSFLFRDPSALK